MLFQKTLIHTFFSPIFSKFYVFYSSACLSDAQPQFVTFQLKRSRNVSQICRFDKSRTSYTPNAAALEGLFFLFWRTMQYNIRGFQNGDYRFKKILNFLCTKYEDLTGPISNMRPMKRVCIKLRQLWKNLGFRIANLTPPKLQYAKLLIGICNVFAIFVITYVH